MSDTIKVSIAESRQSVTATISGRQVAIETDPIYTADKPYIALKSEIPDISGLVTTEVLSEELVKKQDCLSNTQISACNSGITANDVELIHSHDSELGNLQNDISALQSDKQDALTTAQLEACDSGITAKEVELVKSHDVEIGNLQVDVSALQSGKQNTISDLDDIRAGAKLGETALQSYTETDPVYSADKSSLALKTELPTKVSELTNDAGYLTEHQSLADYAKITDVNTALDLKADKSDTYTKTEVNSLIPDTSDFVTADDVSSTYATKDALPTKTSQLSNDSGFITDISGKVDKSTTTDYITAEYGTNDYGIKLSVSNDSASADLCICENQGLVSGYDDSAVLMVAESANPLVRNDGTNAYTVVDTGVELSGLNTTDKTVVGAINELESGKQDVGDYLSKTDSTANVLGTTTTTLQKISGNQLYAPNGIVFGGTAAAAGLVTRGICGITTPKASGECYKENLYINYDGDNVYDRQLVLSAGNVGSKIANTTNGYTYGAIRGDDMVQYVQAYITELEEKITALETRIAALEG